MMTMPAIMADELGRHIASDFRRLFGSTHQDKAERLDGAARMALECLGKSDALYHNVEHTFLVTLVGRDILHGPMLTERLEPDDYSHLIGQLGYVSPADMVECIPDFDWTSVSPHLEEAIGS